MVVGAAQGLGLFRPLLAFAQGAFLQERRRTSFLLSLSAVLASCSSGGSSEVRTPPAFGVGGTVSGLSGNGLTLRNGADTLSVGSNGSFVLPTRLASGASYSVTVATQPSAPSQTCSVENGTGTVGTADVVTIRVVCPTLPATFAYAAVPHNRVGGGVGSLEFFAFDAATGRLSLQGVLPAAANTYVFNIKTTLSGHQLLISTTTQLNEVLNLNRDDLTLYDLSPTTGAPTLSRLIASPGGGELALHPNGIDLYALASSAVSHFNLTPGAAQGQTLDLGQQAAFPPAISPDGKFLFIANSGNSRDPIPSIYVISLADPEHPRLLSKVAVPFRTVSTVLSRDGKLLYVTPLDAKDPGYVYRVDAAGGLTQAGTFASPSYVRYGVITPGGNFLYLASGDDNKVQGYRLDGAGGVTPIGSGTTVPSAWRPVLSPDGKYLYVTSVPVNGAPGGIYGFAVGTDGTLTAVPGSPFSTGEREYDLTFASTNP